MIVEGLKLMVLGMAIVYVFLIILMVLIIISARVFRAHSMVTPSSSGVSSAKRADDDLIAVLSAAISAYRNRNKKK